MLQLSRTTKYKKNHKGKLNGLNWGKGTNNLCYGEFGIKSLEKGRVTMKQLEASRRVITNKTKRKAKIWVRAFPSKPITKKAKGVRMGKGVGQIKYWIFNIRPGLILFEIEGITKKLAKQICYTVSSKLPVLTKMIQK